LPVLKAKGWLMCYYKMNVGRASDQIIELNKNLNNTDFFKDGIPFKTRFLY
jgi:hypothetical protein